MFCSGEVIRLIASAIEYGWVAYDKFGAKAPTTSELYDSVASYTYNKDVHLMTVNNMIRESYRSRKVKIR